FGGELDQFIRHREYYNQRKVGARADRDQHEVLSAVEAVILRSRRGNEAGVLRSSRHFPPRHLGGYNFKTRSEADGAILTPIPLSIAWRGAKGRGHGGRLQLLTPFPAPLNGEGPGERPGRGHGLTPWTQ